MESVALSSKIHLYLLGSFRLERDGKRVNFPTRKVESLLAYLALFPEQHSREQLAALLWGDSTDEQARHSLRTALGAIRKELSDDLLIADRETVQLNPDAVMWIDTREFEKAAESQDAIGNLQSAISNYRDLLPDFYDDWVVREREHLRLLYINALLQLTQHHRTKSEYAQAIEYAQKVLATDRANEKAHQHLMFCLATTGGRIAALKQYDECKKILHNELNSEPSSETTALRDQIMAELTGAPSREASLTNLPNPLTSFIGREKEIRELIELLRTTRLLTLSGAGGCGKTRLAIELGRDAAATKRFKHGVWWVELAALNDPALMTQSVANVFDLRETADTPLPKLLNNFLREKELLLVLDNCEHLIDACARLAEMLLSTSPKLQILATSREALSVTGETVWRVPSLAVPDTENLPTLDQLTQYDAIKLFVQCASAIAPNWRLDGNARAVAQICTRLDGIPLAIELAAARLKALSAEQIATRLDDRFQLLTGGSRTALLRQQTLRATIDWSYDLLSEQERDLLRQLSVFAGGWTLKAVESVCSGDGMEQNHVLDLLTKLLDKSLVVAEERDGEMRYGMLDTIQEYAREKLEESGETNQVRDRHLEFFCELAKQAEPKLISAEQLAWLDQLDLEHDNIRIALAWAQKGSSVIEGLQLASSLWRFWAIRGYLREGREYLENFLAKPEAIGNKQVHANGLWKAGALAFFLGDYAGARPYLEKSEALSQELGLAGKQDIAYARDFLIWQEWNASYDHTLARRLYQNNLKLFEEVGDLWGIAQTIHALGTVSRRAGDLKGARAAYTQSLTIFQEMGENMRASSLITKLGMVAFLESNYAKARALFEEALVYYRRTRYQFEMDGVLWMLGVVAIREHDYARARIWYTECLMLDSDLGKGWQLPECLIGFADISIAEKDFERAVRLLGAAEAQEEARAPRLEDFDLTEFHRLVGLLHGQLDDRTFDIAWAKGRAMTMDQAVEYALVNVKSIS